MTAGRIWATESPVLTCREVAPSAREMAEAGRQGDEAMPCVEGTGGVAQDEGGRGPGGSDGWDEGGHHRYPKATAMTSATVGRVNNADPPESCDGRKFARSESPTLSRMWSEGARAFRVAVCLLVLWL